MKTPKPKKIQLKRSQKITKFGQKIYLACSNFNNNNLLESSSSCAFGFIFSFIPLTVMIVTVLLGIIKISPNVSAYVFSFADEIESIVDIRPIVNNIMTMKAFHFYDIVLAIWIIWMARRMFMSIIQAMTRIFRSVSKRKNLFNQLFVFLCEFVCVILIAIVILAAFSMNKLANSEFFTSVRSFFPAIISNNSHVIVSSVMYFIIFNATALIYRFMSGVKPPFRLCSFYAFLSTVCFYATSYFINKFLNLTNYNIVYGTISTIIVLMMKVWFFFVIFLFFAQMIYVTEFFDTLLESEIYLLPTKEVKGPLTAMRRMLFINPAALKRADNTLYFYEKEMIYKEGDPADRVYYLRKGKISITNRGITTEYPEGSFIGEKDCILNQPRTNSCMALTDCKLIQFTSEEFITLMERSPKAAAKAISKISEETAFLYNTESH